MTQSIEATGPDIESAVADAVAQLGVTPDRVQVEVLEEPVRRLLGLGLRPARVRVTVIGTVAEGTAPAAKPVLPPPAAESKPAAPVEVEAKPETSPAVKPEAKPKPAPEPPRRNTTRSVREAAPDVDVLENDQEAVQNVAAESAEDLPVPSSDQVQLGDLDSEQPDNDAQAAAEVLRQLMGFLSIEGTVAVRHAETDGREARH